MIPAMDLSSANAKMASSHSHNHFLRSNSFSRSSIYLKKLNIPNLNFNRNRNLLSNGVAFRPLVVRAMGKKNSNNSSGNGDHSVPEEDSLKRNNPSARGNKSSDSGSQKSPSKTLDWREFRASLYLREQASIETSDTHKKDNKGNRSIHLGSKWAHPLSSPETGCVLMATEKLDGDQRFERSVIFLLGCGHPHEDPYGVIINRPLSKKLKQMNPNNLDLSTTFGDCLVHFGGPVEASMFLLKASSNKAKVLGLNEVIPGVFFGSRDRLDEAAALVKKGVLEPHDFRFLVGYAGWDMNQLRGEIEVPLWHVAACSSDLLFGESGSCSSEGLWEEILQEMGGDYSELSRKPKQDL